MTSGYVPVVLGLFKNMRQLELDNMNLDMKGLISYQQILEECLFEEKIGRRFSNEEKAGFAAVASADCYRRLGNKNEALNKVELSKKYFTEINNVYGIALSKWAKGIIYSVRIWLRFLNLYRYNFPWATGCCA